MQREHQATHPDIIPLLNQHEWQATLLICQAYPHLAIHKEPMMQVDHWFRRPGGRSFSALVLLAGEAVYAK